MTSKIKAKGSKGSANGKASKAAPQNNGFMPRKTECPVSLATFLSEAPEVALAIEGNESDPVSASPRAFSTGSFGYFVNGKFTIHVNGVPVKFQLSGNLIAVGSKEAPRS